MARRIAVSILVTSALIAGAFALGGGCAQIIGADFDKPFATGGGGATASSTTADSSASSGSTSGPGSSSASVGPLCGNSVCDADEDVCTCSDCPDKCGDNCCSGAERKCNCEADCKDEVDVCGDTCCSGDENDSNCPGDCKPGCGDGSCDTSTETCESCPAECGCTGSDLCTAGVCKSGAGVACDDNGDCGSDNCVDLICCAEPCFGPCRTCLGDGTGCMELPSDALCPGSPECVSGLCRCANGVMDGPETDIDCGGDCLPCLDSFHCAVETDCVSTFCCDCAANGLVCVPTGDCVAECPM